MACRRLRHRLSHPGQPELIESDSPGRCSHAWAVGLHKGLAGVTLCVPSSLDVVIDLAVRIDL